MEKIKNDLEMDFTILNKWFHENHTVLDPRKYHDIVIGDDDPSHKLISNRMELLVPMKKNFSYSFRH